MSDSPGKQNSPATSPKAAGASKSPLEKSPSPLAKSPPKSPSSAGADEPLRGSYWTAAPIEPEEEDDPTLGDNSSSTASISSSILEYRTIQGRTYHSDRFSADYWGANDEAQNDSMDIVHHVHTLTLDGKLFLAPIKDDIQKVVDIGTGTGIWAIDFGDMFPNCEIVGTDISPIQPGWVPPNVKFQIDDCDQPWTFDPESIDFVHIRYMTGSVKDWDALMKQAFQSIKPGGYLESFESTGYFVSDDGTVKEDSALAQWGKFFYEGGKKIGRDFRIVDKRIQRAALESAGFVDIEERDFKVPVGKWPKDPRMKQIGEFVHAGLSADVEGYVLYMATLLGWTKDEVTVYAAHLRREMRNTAIHGYAITKVVWGRKPGAP